MYKNLNPPNVVIKSIEVMTLNIFMVGRTLEVLWMFYRGAHKLAGSLPEDSHRKSSPVARLGNN